jgi:hypothetical protein
MGFVPDYFVEVVFFSEAFGDFGFVLPDALGQIGGNANVEGA